MSSRRLRIVVLYPRETPAELRRQIQQGAPLRPILEACGGNLDAGELTAHVGLPSGTVGVRGRITTTLSFGAPDAGAGDGDAPVPERRGPYQRRRRRQARQE